MTPSELASALGKLAKGVKKKYSTDERLKRSERMKTLNQRREHAKRQNQQHV